MHKVAEGIEAAVSVPLIHIADVVAEAARAEGIARGRPLGHGVHHGAVLL